MPFPGCHSPSNPSGPPPPAVGPLSLACPPDIRIEEVKAPTSVTFAAPIATGGLQPIAFHCTPGSGAVYAIGSTSVSCSATDAATPPRTAVCGLTVTLVAYVPPIPTISETRFMAFGDSFTNGEINDDDTGARCVNRADDFALRGLRWFARPEVIIRALAYPALVQGLLQSRYTSQTFAVVNEGQSLDDTGNTGRFRDVLRSDRPEGVLFLQGVIDLSGGVPISTIIANIDTDIAEARRQGVKAFFLSTLTPVLDYSRGCFLRNQDIRSLNDAIRALAAARVSVYLVDSAVAFQGQESTLVGKDGLHPSVAGQQVLADTFFGVMRSALENAATASALARPDVKISSPPQRQSVGIRHRQ